MKVACLACLNDKMMKQPLTSSPLFLSSPVLSVSLAFWLAFITQKHYDHYERQAALGRLHWRVYSCYKTAISLSSLAALSIRSFISSPAGQAAHSSLLHLSLQCSSFLSTPFPRDALAQALPGSITSMSSSSPSSSSLLARAGGEGETAAATLG